MDANTRLELLFQMSGYFRKKEQTSEQGIGESMEKMLMIGMCFGGNSPRPQAFFHTSPPIRNKQVVE